ncbi:MAG: hypothetical protein KGY50_03990 [Candidatus Thermoplasmatota archaeon]|nr:hypothetical protein [Candidatus Thermoplasmatota archaeon]
MKQKIIEKPDSEKNEFSEENEFISISWEEYLGREVQLFWESFDEEFEE